MSYYIVGNFDGSDDLTGGSTEDIYGGLISGGIVDGGYESFLGGLGVHAESSDSDTEDVDDDRESSSSESSSDSELDNEVQTPPKKALNKLLEDPDVEPDVELNDLEDEHHEQTIEDILNMDDDEAGDLDEVNGGGKKKPAEPVTDNKVHEEIQAEQKEESHEEEDIEFGVEESHEEIQAEQKEEIQAEQKEEIQAEQKEESHEEEDIEFGVEESHEEIQAKQKEESHEEEDIEFGVEDNEKEGNEKEDIEFGVEDNPEIQQEDPNKNKKKKLERSDNLEVDIKSTTITDSTLGGSKFGDALSAYLTNS